jgi:hypothetical protein
MAKNLTTVIFLFFLVNIVVAQRFDGGAIIGFNATQVEGDSYRGFHKPGVAAGFYVETDLAPAVFAAFEIKFMQKGARKKTTENDPLKYIMRLNYIDLPIYAAFRPSEKTAIIGGISPGFLLSGKEFNNDGEFPPEDQNDFNAFDLQALVGFQFEMSEKWKTDLRFAYSLIPVRDKNPMGFPYYWDRNQFNFVATLALYYQFGRR